MDPPYVEVPCADGVRRLEKGFRFIPTDQELVKYYLLNKAFARQLPCEVIPQRLFESYDPDHFRIHEYTHAKGNEAYLFIYNDSKEYPATKGSWQTTGNTVDVYYGSKTIGYKTRFDFCWEKHVDKQESADKYIMYEYRLNPAYIANQSDDAEIWKNVENLVLCKVQLVDPDTPILGNPLSKKARNKLPSAEETSP